MVMRQADQKRDTDASGDVDLQLAHEAAQQLIRLVRLTHRYATCATKRGPDGMDKAAFILLFLVIEQGPLQQRALAEAAHLDPSTVSRQVAYLIDHGMVERQADPTDGRASRLAATTVGKEICDRKHRARNDFFAHVLSDWSREDRTLLVQLLKRFANDYETQLPALLTALSHRFTEMTQERGENQ
jgi:DNA-binding MarR family transcriptional regulator